MRHSRTYYYCSVVKVSLIQFAPGHWSITGVCVRDQWRCILVDEYVGDRCPADWTVATEGVAYVWADVLWVACIRPVIRLVDRHVDSCTFLMFLCDRGSDGWSTVCSSDSLVYMDQQPLIAVTVNPWTNCHICCHSEHMNKLSHLLS